MASFPPPKGYSSLKEALDRAADKWSRQEALDRLRGLLISGSLIAWRVYENGDISEYPVATWRDAKNNHHLVVRNPYRIDDLPTLEWGTFFRTSDLDEQIPTMSQQIERYQTPSKNGEVEIFKQKSSTSKKATLRPDLPAPRARGPKPRKFGQIKSAMLTVDLAELKEMKEEEMASRFGGSRDTCRRCRDAIEKDANDRWEIN